MTELLPHIVYVLANPAMPGLVKLGKTTQQEAKQALHGAFGANRIHPIRVFFKPSRRPRRKLCELAIPHGLILLSAEDATMKPSSQRPGQPCALRALEAPISSLSHSTGCSAGKDHAHAC